MSKIIDKFSLVHDEERDMWLLCKNEDVASVIAKIDSQYDDGETSYSTKLRKFVIDNLDHGEYLEINGDTWGGELQISASTCAELLEDCFEDWFKEEEINELLKGETCMYEAMQNKMAKIAKALAIEELESMLESVNKLDENNYDRIWS